MKKIKNRNLSIRMTDEFYKTLQQLAKKENRSISNFARELIIEKIGGNSENKTNK